MYWVFYGLSRVCVGRMILGLERISRQFKIYTLKLKAGTAREHIIRSASFALYCTKFHFKFEYIYTVRLTKTFICVFYCTAVGYFNIF